MKYYVIVVPMFVAGIASPEPTRTIRTFARRDGPEEDDTDAVALEALASIRSKFPDETPGEPAVFPLTKERYETQIILQTGLAAKRAIAAAANSTKH